MSVAQLRALVDQAVSFADDPAMPSEDANADPWLRFLRFDIGAELRSPEMILDGVISCGSVVLTGDRGAGKSTLGGTIGMLAAHLCPQDHPLRPSLRRNVVYISEDPAQAQLIVRALLLRWGKRGNFTAADIESRIRFVQAVPRSASALEAFGKEIERLSVPNQSPHTGETYSAAPLVILDTRSACLAVDDESANAEASAAMSHLRQYVRNVLLISHPPKGNAKTTRGAGAWEADAQQVVYLSLDPATRVRTVHLAPDAEREAKRRFESPIESLVVSSDIAVFEAIDPLGRKVELRVRYCDAMPERSGQKGARQDDEQMVRVLHAVRRGATNGTTVREALNMKKDRALELVRLAVERGLLERVTVPNGSRSGELRITSLGVQRMDA